MSKDEEKDVRRTYLLRVASHILGLNIVEEKLRQLQAIDAFCDTNATVLSVALTEQKGIDLSNAMKSGTLPKVVFYKTRPTPLTTDNYKLIVNVMSMNGASNEVFLKSVQNVFSKNISESLQTTANKHLLSLVNELEENLLATVDGGKNGGEGGVVSVQDEIRLWKSRSGSAAQQYSEAFEPLQIAVDTSEVRSLLCEQVSSKIDAENLWKNANAVEQLSAGQ
ncbi:hypothetical protein ANCDUO_01062 [Ancylostoma duodenale]|uniref:Uncharacterized protein n=1 Tax=Ancylostoma duodenale TaxID=51022 RepID=A0A0C2HG73_9BILA|nr:hypothetical protein ANCDUO_01062 [Ancylostoma duodenale]